MAYVVLTCDGYRRETEASTLRSAIRAAIDLERRTKDGFARVVSLDGRLVADAEGAYPREPHVPDAATQRGDYDRY